MILQAAKGTALVMFRMEPCDSAAGKRNREHSQDSSAEVSVQTPHAQYNEHWEPSKARRVEVRKFDWSVKALRLSGRRRLSQGCYPSRARCLMLCCGDNHNTQLRTD